MPVFSDRPNQYVEQQSQTLGSDPNYVLGVVIICFLVIVIATTTLYFSIRFFKRYKLENSKSIDILETKSSWRFIKVFFWIIIFIFVSYLFLNPGETYNKYPTSGTGVIVAIVSYPLFVVLQRISMYIIGIKGSSNKTKSVQNKKD